MSNTPSAPKVSVIHGHRLGQPALWIIQLSEQLRKDGVDASLDIWDLKAGQDIYSHLEEALHKEDDQQVVLLVDAIYLQEARNSAIEQLLRTRLYSNARQKRIIPVLHLPQPSQEALPPYLEARFCIDYSEEAGYQRLLEAIYEYSDKPKLGKRPDSLDSNYFSARPYLEQFAQQAQKINRLSQDFFKAFLKQCQREKINYSALRVAWREWLNEVVIKDNQPSFNTTPLLTTFEELYQIAVNRQEKRLDYFLQELFLAAVVIGFKERNFTVLENLLQGSYYKTDTADIFVLFNTYQEVDLATLAIEEANQLASYLRQHLQPILEEEDFRDIVQADLMCYYIGLMKGRIWVPFLAQYIEAENYPISWLKKMEMEKFFHKTKGLYGVEDPVAFGKGMNRAFLKEQTQLPLPYKVLPLQETGLPQKVAVRP